MSRPPITPEMVGTIVEMGQAKVSVKEIAAETGVSIPSIYTIFHNNGIAVGKPGAPRIIDRLDPEVVEQALADYQETDIAVSVIVARLGLTHQSFYMVLDTMGIQRRLYTADRIKARKEQMNLAVAMYQSSQPYWKIEQETGIHQPTLSKELHKRGIQLRGRGNSGVTK